MGKFYGFEDYNLFTLSPSSLLNLNVDTWDMRAHEDYNKTLFLPSNNYAKIKYGDYYAETDNIVLDHKDIISTAEKVYIHPSCSISRNNVTTKYKKILNPWFADIIVVPSPADLNYSRNSYVFINEKNKNIYIVDCHYYNQEDEKEYLDSFKEGTLFKDIMKCKYPNLGTDTDYGILESELMYSGKVIRIENKDSYIADILTGMLPKDKTVYEETIQHSLASEDTKINLDVLLSIRDMLNSTDADIVGTALRTLSTMDYINYPNSVLYVLDQAGSDYRYNKAAHSTSVKFMLKQLIDSRRYIRYKDDITEKDYELLKEYIKYINQYNEGQLIYYLRNYPFMTYNASGLLIPNIKS